MQIVYNNTEIDVKKGTKVCDLLEQEISKSENEVIACKFNNELKSLNYEINSDGKIELIDVTHKDGMRVYKRGLIYIIAKAFQEVYNNALITVDYQLYHSMLCEVDNMKVTEEMIEKVNKRAQEIIDQDLPIVKRFMTKEEAEKFYEKEKTLKGKLQLDLKEKKEVTLYYCENYYNYFYGVMPISTGCIKKYELLKYHDGFLIRYPSRKDPDNLPKFIECPKLLETLDEYEDVHRILGVNTLYRLNTIIKKDKIKDYILLDEALHGRKLQE